MTNSWENTGEEEKYKGKNLHGKGFPEGSQSVMPKNVRSSWEER